MLRSRSIIYCHNTNLTQTNKRNPKQTTKQRNKWTDDVIYVETNIIKINARVEEQF